MYRGWFLSPGKNSFMKRFPRYGGLGIARKDGSYGIYLLGSDDSFKSFSQGESSSIEAAEELVEEFFKGKE